MRVGNVVTDCHAAEEHPLRGLPGLALALHAPQVVDRWRRVVERLELEQELVNVRGEGDRPGAFDFVTDDQRLPGEIDVFPSHLGYFIAPCASQQQALQVVALNDAGDPANRLKPELELLTLQAIALNGRLGQRSLHPQARIEVNLFLVLVPISAPGDKRCEQGQGMACHGRTDGAVDLDPLSHNVASDFRQAEIEHLKKDAGLRHRWAIGLAPLGNRFAADLDEH